MVACPVWWSNQLKTKLILAAVLSTACAGCSDDETNQAPTVNAGASITADEDEIVSLDATVSDPDDAPVITWSQIAGPTIALSSTAIEDPNFRTPRIQGDAMIVLRITANDGVNAPVSDDIAISVRDVFSGPPGPSPQGIPSDGRDRRDRARNQRRPDRPIIAGREARTYDGSNNNVANASWGATFEHLQRLGAADYADGISSLAGALRPSPREISNIIVNQDDGASLPNAVNGSDFVWQWGQFLDHDLDLTDGAEESANIPVPTGDSFFDPDGAGAATIPLSRALFDPATGTDASNPREQENEITSWIDGSMIYGSDDDRATALRVSADSPFLATSAGNLLPFNVNNLTNANGFVTDTTTLFLAGDVRVNEQVGLAVMHTLFVREHNRIAQELADANPTKNAEDIFQEARRMVIGKIQYITYNEWLPVLLGPGAIPGYSGYDDSLNPTIFNEFSVAAFRLGHSMLNEQLLRLDAAGNEIPDGNLDLAEAFFTAPTILQDEDDLDPVLRGLAAQRHQKIDVKIVSDVRNFLFGQPGDGGLDLASLNIQRGRDHGVPSYNAMREAMGLARRTAFDQITSDADLAAALSSTYGSIDEIDLWVGGLAEEPVAGSQLGPLFQAILVKQFTELRDGDRF